MLSKEAVASIFTDMRTHNGWLPKLVTDDQLHAIYDLMKWGPTSANCQPARIVFVRTQVGKDKLRLALSSGNVEKTMTAPVTAVLGYDIEFYEFLPRVFPHDKSAIHWFKGTSDAEPTAFRNGTLQGAYFMIAARALGLDCGPVSGFDNKKVDDAFFPSNKIKSNFLCNLGYGDHSKLFDRHPRLEFDEVCRLS